MANLGRTLEFNRDDERLISEYLFIEKRTGEFAPPTIFITFVELGRFTKTEAECRSERDRVFYWFNNSYMASETPTCASGDPEMQSLVEATRIAAFPPEKMNIYNRDIMRELDIKYSEKKRFEAGLAKGREEGREEGVAKRNAEIVMSMKNKGFNASEISEITGLSLEAIAVL